MTAKSDQSGEDAAILGKAPSVAGKRTPTIPLSVCIGWGLASLVLALVNNTFNFVLLRYLTDMVGMSSAFAGAAVAVAKIVDALAHPVVGSLSDNTRTRFGRRRPYIMLGGAICALAMLGTFNLHHIEAIRWAMTFTVVALLIYGIGFAFVIVPTIAMSAEMTTDPIDRMRLVSVRVYMLGIGQLIGSSCAPLLLSAGGSPSSAYSLLSWTVALVTMLGCTICFIMTKKARATVQTARVKLPPKERFKLAMGNKPFMVLLVIKLLFWVGVALTNGLSAYFTRYVLEVSDAWLGIYNALKMVGWIAAQEFWVRIAARRGKRYGFGLAAICYAAAYATWLFAGPNEGPAGIVIRAILIGIATGGVALNAQAMLPDTIQYDHHRTGLRREGAFSGMYSLVETVAFSTGITLIGVLLSGAGYISGTGGAQVDQPQSAIVMIHYAYVLTPIICAAGALIALRFYGLGPKEIAAMNKASNN